MKTLIKFAAVALAGAAQATFQTLNIEVDGVAQPSYYKGQKWSDVYEGDTQDIVEIKMNNNIFLKEEAQVSQDSDFHFDLRGGSMTYTVDVSRIDCGCVAGAYLVQTNANCTQDPYDYTIPQCKSIDVMSANILGFNVEAHPCGREGGACDVHSRCQYDMLTDGIAKYGSDAYGPFGTKIDTFKPFEVKTEFLSTADKSEVWGLRSTLTQGDQSMEFSADCRHYIEELTQPLNADMSIVFSTWSNTDNRVPSFKRSEFCPAVEPNCDLDDGVMFSNVSFLTSGSNIDPPARQATFEAIPMTHGSTSSSTLDYWVKGRDARDLDTAGTEIIMGEDNYSFVWELPDDSSVDNAYEHDLVGGSLSFNVDVTQMDESCAGGVSLVNLKDQTCSVADVEAGNCKPHKLFEANKHALEVNFSENCQIKSKQSTWYKPEASAWIDSMLPYDFELKFESSWDKRNITQATMIVKQGTSQITYPVSDLNCPTFAEDFAALKNVLQAGNLQITNMALEDPNDFSGIKNHERCVNPVFGIGNIKWTEGDLVKPKPVTPSTFVFQSYAERQDMGACNNTNLCAVCEKGYYSNDTATPAYQCTEEGNGTVFYSKPCEATTKAKKNLCNHDSTQPCFWSWSVDENQEKDGKLKKRCRNLPDAYDNTLGDEEWYYDPQSAHKNNKKKGLCALATGCAGECLDSWPLDDPNMQLSAMAMIRCVPSNPASQ